MNWGPWDQVGMVSDAVKNQFIERGVQLIPPTGGAEALCAEMEAGSRSEPVVALGGGPGPRQRSKRILTGQIWMMRWSADREQRNRSAPQGATRSLLQARVTMTSPLSACRASSQARRMFTPTGKTLFTRWTLSVTRLPSGNPNFTSTEVPGRTIASIAPAVDTWALSPNLIHSNTE